MLPANFLTPERISCGNEASSKKRVLEEIGKLLASSSAELTQEMVFDKLLERERLGSTGLGLGIGLPHARMAGVEQACGAFIQL
ncbi:MAG: PTS sugar transporter subunit IIA, partial [Candidatus Sedimenticola endophacoides]